MGFTRTSRSSSEDSTACLRERRLSDHASSLPCSTARSKRAFAYRRAIDPTIIRGGPSSTAPHVGQGVWASFPLRYEALARGSRRGLRLTPLPLALRSP